MKNIIVTVCCITGLISGFSSNAQGDNHREFLPMLISATSSNVTSSTKINQAFLGYFKNATKLSWYEVDNKFLVKFLQNDLENRALFTKKGQLVYHICYGTEKLLPANVRELIKTNYYDQAITRVLQVNQDRKQIWVIHMEDDKEFIMARVEDMDLEETKRMTKTK